MQIKLVFVDPYEAGDRTLVNILDENGKTVNADDIGLPIHLDDGGYTLELDVLPPLHKVTLKVVEATGERLYTQSEVDAILRAAFPTVRADDMGDHVTLILDAAGLPHD
jgi:hypothetical protein